MPNLIDKIKNFAQVFYMPTFNFTDLLEILLIIYVIYKLISTLKDTRAWVVLKGVLMLCVFYIIAYVFQFDIIKVIFQSAITVLLIGIVIIFQQDLRRLLEQIGNKKIISYIFDFKHKKSKDERPKRFSDKTINEIVDAVFQLGKAKTGSLIVIEKDIPLDNIISTGISINSEISSALLINIFEKNTPLHDGAVVIKNDKIISATCYLPLSTDTDISKSLGTRHRAGIGVTETADCFVVISSEETGAVSCVTNGKIERNLTPDKLREALKSIQEYPQLIGGKKHRLTHNFKIKVASVFLGLILWIIAMATIDPVSTMTIEDIPLTIVNESAITSIDKVYDLGDIETVDVVVEDKRSVLDKLTANDFKATVDLSCLSYVNTVDVNITINNDTSEIKSISDDVIKVNIDDVSYAEFSIETLPLGETPKGFAIKNIELSSDTVTVTGAEKQINKIDRVVAEISVSNMVNGQTIEFTPIVYDRNGDIIDNKFLGFSNNSFNATIYLQPTKDIPLKINIVDAEDSMGQIKDISYDVTQISVAGDDELLSDFNILEITLPVKIEITNDNNTKLTKTINLTEYLPEGITIRIDDPKVTISITYEPYQTKEIEKPTNEIAINGQNEAMTYAFKEESIIVPIIGPQNILDEIVADDITLSVDVSEIQNIGTNDIEVAVNCDKNAVINPINTQIFITMKPTEEEEATNDEE